MNALPRRIEGAGALSLGQDLQALRTQLVRKALRRGPSEYAEDAAQETLCRALARTTELDPARVHGWLNVVVENVATDAWRAHARTHHLRSKLRHYRSEVQGDQSEDILDGVLARQAAAVIATLPPLQREILTSLACGNTIKEIANDKALSLRSVEGHLRRARKSVRRWLLA